MIDMIKKMKDKILYCKKEIGKEIGSDKIKEFGKASYFRKSIKIIKIFLLIIGFVSSFLSICSFFRPDNNLIALENYQKGIVYFEDQDLEKAEQFFLKAYSQNRDLLDIKYYYAITEFYLQNLDKSYQILKENRYSLNEDELAFYARYEVDRDNYEKGKEYINKIQRPEKLKNPALAQYIMTSLNLAALENYNALCNTVYRNTVLLNRVINANENLINNCKLDFNYNDIEIDQEKLNKMIGRINQETEGEILMLKMYKMYMYMYFSSYSIKLGKNELPIFIFIEASESIDYLNYNEISVNFLQLLDYYTIQLDMASKYLEEIKIAYENVVKEYDELLEKDIIPTDETRKSFETTKLILKCLNENTFNPNNFNYILRDEKGKRYENISPDDFLKIWDKQLFSR